MSFVYIHVNYIEARKVVDIRKKIVPIKLLSEVVTVGDFLQFINEHYLGTIGEKMVLYSPKKARIVDSREQMKEFRKFKRYYVAVFEGSDDQEQYLDDLLLLENNIQAEFNRGYYQISRNRTPKHLAMRINQTLEKMTMLMGCMKGDVSELQNFAISPEKFEMLCTADPLSDARSVPEQLLARLFSFWIEKVCNFLSVLYAIREKIGFTGGNMGSASTFHSWKTSLPSMEGIYNDQAALASLFFRLNLTVTVPTTMEMLEGLIDKYQPHAWFANLITAAEDVVSQFGKQFAMTGDLKSKNQVLFTLNPLFIAHYERDERPFSAANNFRKNSLPVFQTIAFLLLHLDAALVHSKKWFETVQHAPKSKDVMVSVIINRALYSVAEIISEASSSENEVKFVATQYPKETFFGVEKPKLFAEIESYTYYLNFEPATAFFQWGSALSWMAGKPIGGSLATFQKFLGRIINNPQIKMTSTPVDKMIDYVSLVQGWTPRISSVSFMSQGIVSASNANSIVQVLTHWFRAYPGSQPHPAYARLFDIWREKNTLASSEVRGTERVVMKMLLDPQGSYKMSVEKLINAAFGPTLRDPDTGLTLVDVTKTYAAVKLMERLSDSESGELKLHIPAAVVDGWVKREAVAIVALFNQEKYADLRALETIIEQATFVANFILVTVNISKLVEELTHRVLVVVEEREAGNLSVSGIEKIMVQQDLIDKYLGQMQESSFKKWASKRLAQLRSACFYYRNQREWKMKKPRFFKHFFVLQEMVPDHLYTNQRPIEPTPILSDYLLTQQKFKKRMFKQSASSSSSSFS
jgi:hypothetical protein